MSAPLDHSSITPLTVAELIELLQNQPQDALVGVYKHGTRDITPLLARSPHRKSVIKRTAIVLQT